MGGGKYDAPEPPSAADMISVVNAQIEGQKEMLDEYLNFAREQLEWQKPIATGIAEQQMRAMELQNDQARSAFIRDEAFGQYAEEKYAELLADTNATREEKRLQRMWTDFSRTQAEKSFLQDLTRYAEPREVKRYQDMLRKAQSTPDEMKQFMRELRNYEDPALVDKYIKALATYKDPKSVQQFVNTLKDYKPPAELDQAIKAMAGAKTPEQFKQAITALTSYQMPPEMQGAMNALVTAGTTDQMRQAITELEDWDSTARVREAEAVASADVRAGAEAARTAAMQRLEQFGIDPSQTRSAGLDRELRAQMAAQQALAASQARREIQVQGLQAQVQAGQLSTAERDAAIMRAVQAGEIATEDVRYQLDALVRAGEMSVAEQERLLGKVGQAAELAVQRDSLTMGAQREAMGVELDAAQRELQMLGTAADAKLQSKLRELGMSEAAAQAALGEIERKVRLSGENMAVAVESTLRELGISGQAASEASRQQMMRFQAATEAANLARRVQAEDIGRQGEIANVFSGLPAQATNIYAAGQGAASTALTASQVPIDSATQAYGTGAKISQGISGQAIDMFGQQVNLYGQQVQSASAEAAAKQNFMNSILGGVTGLLGFDRGGEIPEELSPSRGVLPDDVNIKATGGEYLFPQEVVRYYGTAKLDQMREKAQKALGLLPE